MVYVRRKRSLRPRRAYKKRSNYRKRTAKPTAKFSRMVRRVIQKVAEHKMADNYFSNQSIQTGNTSAARNLMISVSQGSSNQQRIGNKISIVSNKITGYINLLPYNATTNSGALPVYVRMFVLSQKLNNSQTFSLTDFFQAGNGSVGPQGNMLDMCFAVNRDLYTVHMEKIIKLGVSASSTTGPANSASWFDNSSMSQKFSFDCAKFAKTWKFDDTGNSNFPTNQNLWLYFHPVYADGTGSSSLTLAEYHLVQHIKYTDV